MNVPLTKDCLVCTSFSVGSRVFLFFLGLLLLRFSTVTTIFRLPSWGCFRHASFMNVAFPNVAFINLFPCSAVLIDLGVVLSMFSQSVSFWVSGSFLRALSLPPSLPPPPSLLLAPPTPIWSFLLLLWLLFFPSLCLVLILFLLSAPSPGLLLCHTQHSVS